MSLDNTLPSRYSGNLKLAILSLLNSLGAINESKAVSINEIARYLGVPKDSIMEVINNLLNEGYLRRVKKSYYISSKGIAIVIGVIS